MDDIVAMMNDGDDGFNEDDSALNDQNGSTPMGATPSGPPPPAFADDIEFDDEKKGEENTGDDFADGEGAKMASAYNPLLAKNGRMNSSPRRLPNAQNSPYQFAARNGNAAKLKNGNANANVPSSPPPSAKRQRSLRNSLWSRNAKSPKSQPKSPSSASSNSKDKNKKRGKRRNAVFGVESIMLSSTLILSSDYASPIPNVLIALRSALFANGGHRIEGIFRVAPNGDECKAVEEELNGGHLQSMALHSVPGEVLANLIKLFFRSLPTPILQNLSQGGKLEREAAKSKAQSVGIIEGEALGEPQKSYFLWLLDLCVDIIKHSAANKMSAKAMAVVMAPNLYDPEKFGNPMKAMTFSAAVVKFLQFVIEHRQQKK